jgi:hypothetical protein
MEGVTSFPRSANVPTTLPLFLRPRHIPDVPEDVDFLMEHLNDPNYDLHSLRRASTSSTSTAFEFDRKYPTTPSIDNSGKGSIFGGESRADSDIYSDGLNSRGSAIDFNEYVNFVPVQVLDLILS